MNVIYGAAPNWLRNHEPSIPLSALLSSLEHGHTGYEELDEVALLVDESLNPEDLVASRRDLLSMLRSLSTEELCILFARWLDFGQTEIAQLLGMQPAAVRKRCLRIRKLIG